jgi:type VI secretion system protein ImpF
MAGIPREQPLVVSVLDRLLDDEPGVSSEPARGRVQVLRALKQSVRRDLENLLNTRTRCLVWPPGLKELKQSLVNYGLPDFTGADLGSKKDREQFCGVVQSVIRQHEPRFKSVRVQLLGNTEPLDRTLRFRIDALLRAEPAPEPVVFDSVLKPATGAFELKGEADE